MDYVHTSDARTRFVTTPLLDAMWVKCLVSSRALTDFCSGKYDITGSRNMFLYVTSVIGTHLALGSANISMCELIMYELLQ